MNSLREKLNDTTIITQLAKKILIDSGKEDHSFNEDKGGFYYDIKYYFEDLPNKHMKIFGMRDLYSEENMRKFLDTYSKKQDLFNIHTIQEYHSLFDENKNFVFDYLTIIWNENPLQINPRDLDKITHEIIEKDSKERRKVFIFKEGKTTRFEKGSWQEYLAKVYCSTLGVENFAEVISKKPMYSKRNIIL